MMHIDHLQKATALFLLFSLIFLSSPGAFNDPPGAYGGLLALIEPLQALLATLQVLLAALQALMATLLLARSNELNESNHAWSLYITALFRHRHD